MRVGRLGQAQRLRPLRLTAGVHLARTEAQPRYAGRQRSDAVAQQVPMVCMQK